MVDKVNIEHLATYENLIITRDSIWTCFTCYKCIIIRWVNLGSIYTNPFGKIFRGEISVMFGTRVATCTITSECRGVTITTSLVEWLLMFSEINSFLLFLRTVILIHFPRIKCVLESKRHRWSGLRNYLTTRSAVGTKSPDFQSGDFRPTSNLEVR